MEKLQDNSASSLRKKTDEHTNIRQETQEQAERQQEEKTERSGRNQTTDLDPESRNSGESERSCGFFE